MGSRGVGWALSKQRLEGAKGCFAGFGRTKSAQTSRWEHARDVLGTEILSGGLSEIRKGNSGWSWEDRGLWVIAKILVFTPFW